MASLRGANRMSNVESRQTRPLEDPAATNGELGNQAAYDEYLRGFDQIPVLQDAVSVPVRPPPPPDFRRGQRPDVRKEARPDSYTARQANLAALERLYDEYSRATSAVRAKRKKARTRKTKSKPRPKSETKKSGRRVTACKLNRGT
jgi:hypothetical protein